MNKLNKNDYIRILRTTTNKQTEQLLLGLNRRVFEGSEAGPGTLLDRGCLLFGRVSPVGYQETDLL